MTRRLETPKEAQARLANAALSGHERAELWRRVTESVEAAPRRRAWRVAAVALPALAIVATLVLMLSRREPAPSASPAPDPCALDGSAGALALPASCGARSVSVGSDRWRLAAGATVQRTAEGASVERGRVEFSVQRRPRSQFRVRVSHGEVRVIGTVFVVEQRAEGGSVTVREGVIEFVWQDGTRERVAAGQSLSWPRAARDDARPAVDTPVKPVRAADAGTAKGTAPDLERVLERLLQLQSQKRFGEAVSLLKQTVSAPGLASLQRERISYELGLALERSEQPSCPHWRGHVERFGTARHADALAERIARCQK